MFSSVKELHRLSKLISTRAARQNPHSCLIFDIDTRCLTDFISLVDQHFTVFAESQDSDHDFSTKDLLRVIKTAGNQSHSRIAFKKAMLEQLEQDQMHYCTEIVKQLKESHPDLMTCKVKKEHGRGVLAYARKWCLTMPSADFQRHHKAFKDF